MPRTRHFLNSMEPFQAQVFENFQGARFSADRRYRYVLWRIWDESRPTALFIMLNPSIANENNNDPTVERCQRRAQIIGYGGLTVCNLFAFCSTNPRMLYEVNDPVGSDNDRALLERARTAGLVVCGWGTNGALKGRGPAVLAMLRANGITPHALKINSDGSPQHPLSDEAAVALTGFFAELAYRLDGKFLGQILRYRSQQREASMQQRSATPPEPTAPPF